MHTPIQNASKQHPRAYRSETTAALRAAEGFGGCVWSDDLGPIPFPHPEVT